MKIIISCLMLVSASCFAENQPSLPPVASGVTKDSKALFAEWAKIRQPSSGAPEPTGTYAAGCLAGAVVVPQDGPGFAGMRLSRRRLFAHPEMVTYIHDFSERLRAEKLPLLLVGDVSPPRGGPMNSGHNSHQIGLDADFWLRMSPKRPSKRERESWSAPSFVQKRKTLRKNWGTKQVKMISAAADFPSVNRVFVSPAIKRYFCDHFATADWLYKIRAWWGHEEHIHVRLSCPAGSVHCESQTALNPKDNGCGAELDWWFSKEADDEWQKIVSDRKPREFPDLPVACEELVKN